VANRTLSSWSIMSSSPSSQLPWVSVPDSFGSHLLREIWLILIDLLQRSGIAWPNAHLPTVSNPLLQAHLPPLTVPLESFNFNHKRQQSLGGLPEWMPSHHDGSSRSTSAYTSYATYPPLEPFGPSAAPPYPASHRETVSPRVDVRMHSDQLRQLIEALSPSKQSATAASVSHLLEPCHSISSSSGMADTTPDKHAATPFAAALDKPTAAADDLTTTQCHGQAG